MDLSSFRPISKTVQCFCLNGEVQALLRSIHPLTPIKTRAVSLSSTQHYLNIHLLTLKRYHALWTCVKQGGIGFSCWSQNFKGLLWTYCLLIHNPNTLLEKKKAFRLLFSHEGEKEPSKRILSFINYLTTMLISILVANPHCIKDRACAMCLKCVSLSTVSSRLE